MKTKKEFKSAPFWIILSALTFIVSVTLYSTKIVETPLILFVIGISLVSVFSLFKPAMNIWLEKKEKKQKEKEKEL